MNSRGVLLPLVVAFVVFWLGTIDLPTAAAKYKPISPKKSA